MFHRGALKQALAHQDEGLFERIHENGQSACLGAAFDAIKLVYGGEIEGVGGKSVEGVGGDGDDTAADKEMRRVTQCIDFRCLRVNAQQFCRQFFGPRRSRKTTPQRSAALPLFGRRYHGWNRGSNGEGRPRAEAHDKASKWLGGRGFVRLAAMATPVKTGGRARGPGGGAGV